MADKNPSSVRIVLRKPRNPFVVAALPAAPAATKNRAKPRAYSLASALSVR